MLEIDCAELTPDEQLALAGEISDDLAGRALALEKNKSIVIDWLGKPDGEAVRQVVARFLSKRKDAQYYSMETEGDKVVVHSADPVAAAGKRRVERLPPNVHKCPFCPFVTPYEELYVVHYRAHGFT